MFIQVIQGPCSDAETLRDLAERWTIDLGPGAVGWLGTTYGITDDGRFIGVVRFTDGDAAERNSNRAEQSGWWAEAEKCFSGPVTFHNSEEVMTFLHGGSDDAGFVQVIQGKVRDGERLREMMARSDELGTYRSDVIGGTVAFADDGTFTETVAFTSEAAAREGEATQMPEEFMSVWEESTSDLSYYDLRDPWFASPR